MDQSLYLTAYPFDEHPDGARQMWQANCPHLLLLETSSTRHFNIPGILHVLLHAACPESELMHMERDEIPRVSEVTSFSVSAKFCSVKHFQQTFTSFVSSKKCHQAGLPATNLEKRARKV